jgi:hypothetical protein
MIARLVLCLVVGLASMAAAQSAGDHSHADKSMLIALENAWNQAQLHHDSKALNALLADSFVSTDNEGTFANKSQFLADNKDAHYAPMVMANTEENVFLYDKTAIVAGIYHAKGLYKGKPFDHFGRFTDTWVLIKGKWVCVASHTSPLKK